MQTSFPLLNLNANTGDHYFSAPNTNNNGSKGMTEEEKKEFEDAKQELLDHSQRIKNNEDFVVKFEQDGIHLHEEDNKMKNTMKTVNNIIFKRLKSQDQQYDSVSTRIDKFEASITTSVQSNESTIQDVSSKVTKNENDIANVQTQIDQKVDDKVTSAVQLTKYEIKETVQSNATSISELRESLSSQNADVQSNTSAIAQITQDVNADIQQLSTAQTQFQTQVDKTVDDKVTTAVRSIQSQIDNSSAEQNTNVADIKTDFNSKLSNVNAQIQQLSTAQTQFQTQVEKTVDDKVTTAVQSIQSQIDNSSAEQNNNVADITTDFNSKLSNVNAQIQQLSTVQTQLKEGVNSTVESNIKYQLAILEEKFTTTINAQIEQVIQTLEKSVQQNVTNFLTVQDPSTTDPV